MIAGSDIKNLNKRYELHDDDITKVFETCDWKTIITELVAYILYILKCYGFNIDKFSNISGGTSPADIAATVIQKIITGERSWDHIKYPDLSTHLKYIARSEIDHVLNSWISKKVELYDSEVLKLIEDSTTDNPVEAYRSKLKEEQREKLFKTMEHELQNKKELLSMFKAILEGCTRSGELAQRFNVDVEEIYNRKKRLRRFILTLKLQK